MKKTPPIIKRVAHKLYSFYIRPFVNFRVRLNRVSIFQDRFSVLCLFGTVLIFFGIIFILIWQFPTIPPQVPFFYTLSTTQVLADKNILYLIPGMLAFLILWNGFLAEINFQRQPTVARLLLGMLSLVSFISLLGLIKIISIVL